MSRVPATDEDLAFIRRTRYARIKRGYTSSGMAKALDIRQDKYKHYEARTKLPHQYVTRFCAIAQVSEQWLFNGPLPDDWAEVFEQASKRGRPRGEPKAAIRKVG